MRSAIAVPVPVLVLAWLGTASAFVVPPGAAGGRTSVGSRAIVPPASPLHAAANGMGADTASLIRENAPLLERIGEAAPGMSEIERLRFALQFPVPSEAAAAAREAQRWRRGRGRPIVDAAREAVDTASIGGGWDNAAVRDLAPGASVINDFITPSNIVTLSTDEGDLVYVIRASLIDDRKMMDRVSVEQLADFFMYAKEVHSIVANERSARTGRLCNVILVNDIQGVRKAPDKRFSKALTSSSDQYEALYPSFAGPTMILNLPLILQAFVSLLKPLFPKSVQERLVFKKAPVLASLEEYSPLVSGNREPRDAFLAEVKSLIPESEGALAGV